MLYRNLHMIILDRFLRWIRFRDFSFLINLITNWYTPKNFKENKLLKSDIYIRAKLLVTRVWDSIVVADFTNITPSFYNLGVGLTPSRVESNFFATEPFLYLLILAMLNIRIKPKSISHMVHHVDSCRSGWLKRNLQLIPD